MALRAVKLLGEHYYAPVKEALLLGPVRQFTASSRLMEDGAKGVSGPGGPAAQSEGVKDMNSGDREALTEGSESPRDVAEALKQHKDAGKSDDAGAFQGKPGDNVDKEQVREDAAGTGAHKHAPIGNP